MGWKIYFLVFIILLIPSYFIIFTGQPTPFDLLDLILSSISVIGLFGFAFHKKLFTQKFWQFWVIVFLVWDISYNLIFSKLLGLAQKIEGVGMLELIIGFIFVIPIYFALFRYGYKSNSLWKQ